MNKSKSKTKKQKELEKNVAKIMENKHK